MTFESNAGLGLNPAFMSKVSRTSKPVRLLASVLLVAALSGCGGADQPSDTGAEAAASATTEQASALTGFAPAASNPVTITTTGPGHVISAASGIDCDPSGASCVAKFDAFAQLTLTAAPAAGAKFLGWSGQCASAGTSPTCTTNNAEARSVAAAFGASTAAPIINHSLSVSVGAGGAVWSYPSGLACGGASTRCSAIYASGSRVLLSAGTLPGYTFAGWSGAACSGTLPTCAVVLTTDKSATARFTPAVVQKTVQLNWSASASTVVSGYKVYHGTQPGSYADVTPMATVASTFTTSVKGTHYFAVSAVNASGQESAKSPEVSVVIP